MTIFHDFPNKTIKLARVQHEYDNPFKIKQKKSNKYQFHYEMKKFQKLHAHILKYEVSIWCYLYEYAVIRKVAITNYPYSIGERKKFIWRSINEI